MSLTTVAIEGLLRNNASIIVDGTQYTTMALEGFARLSRLSGKTLTIKNADSLTTAALNSIVEAGGGTVILDVN